MTDFGALVANPHVWVQWPHVFFNGLAATAFFMLGIAVAVALPGLTRPPSTSRSRWPQPQRAIGSVM